MIPIILIALAIIIVGLLGGRPGNRPFGNPTIDPPRPTQEDIEDEW